MKKILLFFAILSLAAGAEIFFLPAGTKVIAIEDHSYPLVSAVISIKAGAIYEAPDEKGLSHFLEHMLFDGTWRHSRDQLEKAFASMGTYYNAFTRKDFVAFELTALPEHFIPSLKLLCEMIFESAFEDKEFEKEKGVVYQEIMKDRLNPVIAASYLFYERFLCCSPYASPVLGYERIIKNLKKEKVLSFWKRLYSPERMSLIIVGDFRLKNIKGELEALFRRSHHRSIPEPERPIPRWDKSETLPSKTPRVDIALPAPPLTAPEAPAFEVLATLLGSELEKELELRFFSKDYEKFRHIAFLHFAGMGRMLPSAEQVAAAVRRAVERRMKEGFSEAEVERAKRLILNQRLFFNDKKLHFAREIAEWEAKASFELMERFYRRLSRLRAADLSRAMKKTLKPLRLYVLVQKPLTENSYKIKVPPIREGKLDNGLVYVYRKMNSPLLAVHLLAGRRAELEAGSGAAHLLMKTIENQLSSTAEKEGLQIQATDIAFLPFDDFYLNRDFSYIRIEAPSQQVEAVRKALERVLLQPLDRKAFEAAKREALAELRMRLRRPCWIAEEQLRALLLEPPLSTPIYGTLSSLSSLSYSQVEEFRKVFLSPSNLIVSWAGPAEPDQIVGGLTGLKNYGKGLEAMKKAALPEKSRPAGACLCGGWKLSWKQLESLYPSLLVLSEALKDLLAEEVREKRGLSYSLSVRPVLFPSSGYLAISVLTTPEKIKTVREVVEKALAAFNPSKISPEDLRRFRMSAAGRTLRYGERKINQAFYMGWYRYLGLGADYLWRLPALIRKVSKKDLVNLWNRIGEARIICLPQ